MFRNSIIIRVLWGVLGLYLLNISVDAPDPHPDFVPEDLSVNDQESIVEIVVEQILGYKDALIEYDDNDAEEHNNKTPVKIDLLIHDSKTDENVLDSYLSGSKRLYHYYNARLTLGFNAVDYPPPKV